MKTYITSVEPAELTGLTVGAIAQRLRKEDFPRCRAGNAVFYSRQHVVKLLTNDFPRKLVPFGDK